MDFWPADNSLLITTASGTLLRYSFTPTSAIRGPDFATGLGNGKFKVKTGVQASAPLAFVANNNGGEILKFGAPPVGGGSNPPLATVTSGVQRPQGLAASNLAARDAAECLDTAGGCDAARQRAQAHGVGTAIGVRLRDRGCLHRAEGSAHRAVRQLHRPQPASGAGVRGFWRYGDTRLHVRRLGFERHGFRPRQEHLQ